MVWRIRLASIRRAGYPDVNPIHSREDKHMTERTGHCLCGAVSFKLVAEPLATRICWCLRIANTSRRMDR